MTPPPPPPPHQSPLFPSFVSGFDRRLVVPLHFVAFRHFFFSKRLNDQFTSEFRIPNFVDFGFHISVDSEFQPSGFRILLHGTTRLTAERMSTMLGGFHSVEKENTQSESPSEAVSEIARRVLVQHNQLDSLSVEFEQHGVYRTWRPNLSSSAV